MSKPIGKPIIGAFVVGAVVIAVAGLFVLGGGEFLKKKYMRVMYFDGSVKGLKVGAPLTFRGVKIGTVSNIAIRANTEDLTTRIPVIVEIDPDNIETTGGHLDDQLPRLIKRGLRARLELQSMVTGQLQIELDFMPDTKARLMGGKTKYAEIPTVPSTLSKFAKELEKIPLPEIAGRLSAILASVEKFMDNPALEQSVNNLNQTILDLQKLVKDVVRHVNPLLGSATTAIGHADELVLNVNKQIDPLAADLKKTAAAVTGAADVARPAIREVDKAFDNIAALTGKGSEERRQLDRTLKELQAAARSIKVWAEYLERNPEALIRGKGRSKRR
ncbi:MAG: MlaD family protein [Desulfobacterales bacterium]|jgi:paraquat-inducible protein B